MAAEIIQIDTQDLTTQTYTGQDANLISTLDINTSLSLMDEEKGMYFIFDDHGHPISTGVKQAILKSISEGLKVETYIGQPAGYSYDMATTLIDHEGVILSYGK